MTIVKILGKGCAKCNRLEQMVRDVANELYMEVTIEHIKDINDIMNYGVMMTPGLVINEEVKSAGKLPSKDKIKQWIEETN